MEEAGWPLASVLGHRSDCPLQIRREREQEGRSSNCRGARVEGGEFGHHSSVFLASKWTMTRQDFPVGPLTLEASHVGSAVLGSGILQLMRQTRDVPQWS